MPLLHIRSQDEVPAPSRSSRAVREQQRLYEGFIREVGSERVGDLEPGPGESLRSIKVRIRRASSRLNVELEVWDADGHVYFRRQARRGRPRKSGSR